LRALTPGSIAFVRVLALADKRPPMDPALMAQQMGAQAVLLLGDLDLAWIETLRALELPRLGVHGNHDTEHLLREVEVDDLHMRRTALGGLTFAGFEGCVQYGRGGPHHYTQRKASRLARRLPAADVLLCHCPPRGINDDEDDPAHIGFDGLRHWVDEHHPRHILHGHVHPIAGLAQTSHGDTRVHWISGARMLQLD
jgi:Icc-related predicted phosphoesterase